MPISAASSALPGGAEEETPDHEPQLAAVARDAGGGCRRPPGRHQQRPGSDRAVKTGEPQIRPRPRRRMRIHPVAGCIGNAGGGVAHRVRTLPFNVSKVLPPFFPACASGSAVDVPSTSLRLGPAGFWFAACCAMLQTWFCILSVFWWPVLSWSPICAGIPHFAALPSTNLIILISAALKLRISLQASSGGAWRSLAALISLPRFSASSRNGRKPFMQSSAPAGPAEGGCGPAAPKPAPETGAAPLVKAESFAGVAAKGGAGWPLGSGAGNAACPQA